MIALLIGLAITLAAAFVALIVAAVAAAPDGMPTADMLRVYPDLLRLLVPDFIPVVGLADNVVITAWAVRSALRRSGAEVVLSHWRGSPASFILLCKLCRLHTQPELSAGNDPISSSPAPRRLPS